jgi:Family of unknown function (DUF5694)
MRISLHARCLLVATLLWSSCLVSAATPGAEPARVMLVGMFHFANPGRDLVKSRVINVMSPENQAYLDGLAVRLAGFKPTGVLAECSPSEQGTYDQRFKDYLAGRFKLPSNETYQVGFRVARQAGLQGVTCFDEDKIGWNAQPMFEYKEKHDVQTKQAVEALVGELSATHEKEQTSLTLAQLLQLANDPARDAINKGFYVRTNAVGAGDGFAGADASASWWHRNFRMYANIQKESEPATRVIVLAGQGHTAILKDLLAVDGLRTPEDARPYLDAPM